MQSLIGKNIFRFVFLVLFQGLILSYIPLPGHLHLFISILFILLLPHQLPAWLVLVFSFLCGISIDALTATMGLHATSATAAGLIRILFWRVAERNNLHDNEAATGTPCIEKVGLPLFSFYAGIVILTYHAIFYTLDAFSAFDFATFSLILGSSLLCFICILISEKIFG